LKYRSSFSLSLCDFVAEKMLKYNNTSLAKKEIISKTSRIFEQVLNAPKLKDLNEKQLEQITKFVIVDKLKDELEKEAEKLLSKKKLETFINKWLNTFESKHTKRSYKKNLKLFFTWLADKSITEVDSLIVDDYISFLKSATTEDYDLFNNGTPLSEASQRQRIMAPSSFWKSLLRWKVVSNNPWRGANLPAQKMDVVKTEQIPTDAELDEIENFALGEMTAFVPGNKKNTKRKNTSARYAYAVLKILRSTGLRIGAISTLTIYKNGVYNARSKGSKVHGKLKDDVLEALNFVVLNKSQPFKDYKPGTFTMWFWRASGKKYFCHSLRHRYSINWWNDPANGKDIIKLKNLLFHKSVRSTEVYLSTLRYELGVDF